MVTKDKNKAVLQQVQILHGCLDKVHRKVGIEQIIRENTFI